jgi:hypothetical protein
MTLPSTAGSGVDHQERALLELIEADRAQQNALALGEAHRRAAAVLAQARAQALVRVRTTFAEQRQLQRERLAAAQARVATQRRLHEQQRMTALLRLAWEQLPGELAALWRDRTARAAWVVRVLNAARMHLPRGAWQVLHAPDWPAEERQACATDLKAVAGVEPAFSADPAIVAGLKVLAAGNVVDGTLAGLVADRSDIEAQLLCRLEALP